ncbi:Transthyretin-like protein 15 [Toxocara canis]|uniref:Transthyretin-like protein 15 n=1 Tax=Toxocara canis TaxID=6265 RepID=A0A0B2W4G7_TOXCA|nr:Transthyretin-like protein 15 [Toxocara canis]
MFLRCIVLILVFVSTTFALLGGMKNVTVRGQLLCGRRSYAHAKVELWEDDTCEIFDTIPGDLYALNFDDLLNTTNSDNTGRFKVYGQTREIRNIEPYLLITHNCDDGGALNTHCSYTDRYKVPKESAGKTYEMREVKLDLATKNRKRNTAMIKVLALAAFLAFAEAGLLGSLQHVTVTGQLACDRKSVKKVKIELWEEDAGGPDDLLNTTYSDDKGYFKIYGQEKEITTIDPYLIIYHSCDGGIINEKCDITDEYVVPKDKIGGVYNMGITSLNIARRNHKKKCND